MEKYIVSKSHNTIVSRFIQKVKRNNSFVLMGAWTVEYSMKDYKVVETKKEYSIGHKLRKTKET